MPAPQSWAARRATTVHTSLTMMLSSQVLSSPRWRRMARTCSRARQSLWGGGGTASGQSHTRGAGGPHAGWLLFLNSVQEPMLIPLDPTEALLSVTETLRNSYFHLAQVRQGTATDNRYSRKQDSHCLVFHSFGKKKGTEDARSWYFWLQSSFLPISSVLFTGQQDRQPLAPSTDPSSISTPPPRVG